MTPEPRIDWNSLRICNAAYRWMAWLVDNGHAERIKRRPVRVFSPFKRAVCNQPDRFNMIQFDPMRLYFWSNPK